jgi:hypothetical protein
MKAQSAPRLGFFMLGPARGSLHLFPKQLHRVNQRTRVPEISLHLQSVPHELLEQKAGLSNSEGSRRRILEAGSMFPLQQM